MNQPPQDFGIPMLTEVVETPLHVREQVEDIPELTQLIEPLFPVAAPKVAAEDVHKNADEYTTTNPIHSATITPSTDTLQQWGDDEWAQLQEQITERVLGQMMGRVDTQLETRVRDNLADVLQLAVHQLSEEIRAGLQKTLEDVITIAVKREIENFKFSKK